MTGHLDWHASSRVLLDVRLKAANSLSDAIQSKAVRLQAMAWCGTGRLKHTERGYPISARWQN